MLVTEDPALLVVMEPAREEDILMGGVGMLLRASWLLLSDDKLYSPPLEAASLEVSTSIETEELLSLGVMSFSRSMRTGGGLAACFCSLVISARTRML